MIVLLHARTHAPQCAPRQHASLVVTLQFDAARGLHAAVRLYMRWTTLHP
jgi:hypothetical protein